MPGEQGHGREASYWTLGVQAGSDRGSAGRGSARRADRLPFMRHTTRSAHPRPIACRLCGTRLVVTATARPAVPDTIPVVNCTGFHARTGVTRRPACRPATPRGSKDVSTSPGPTKWQVGEGRGGAGCAPRGAGCAPRALGAERAAAGGGRSCGAGAERAAAGGLRGACTAVAGSRPSEPLEPLDGEDEHRRPTDLDLERVGHEELAGLHDRRHRVDDLRP